MRSQGSGPKVPDGTFDFQNTPVLGVDVHKLSRRLDTFDKSLLRKKYGCKHTIMCKRAQGLSVKVNTQSNSRLKVPAPSLLSCPRVPSSAAAPATAHTGAKLEAAQCDKADPAEAG
eukprot:1160733-Pelagomonas_calceolata.AAC.2